MAIEGRHEPTHGARSRQQRVPLSRERILDAAVEFIDDHCLEELSMRKLGAELGVEAMALYWHVPSKSALLDAVAEHLLGELTLPEPGETDWPAAVRAYARSVRRLARAHPRIFPLLATLAPRNVAVRRNIAAMRRLWRAAGFDEEMQFRAGWAVHGYVMGATLWEVALGAFHQPDEEGAERHWSGHGRRTRGPARETAGRGDEDGGEPPAAFEEVRHVRRLAGSDDAFEFGLDVIISGLEADLWERNGRAAAGERKGEPGMGDRDKGRGQLRSRQNRDWKDETNRAGPEGPASTQEPTSGYPDAEDPTQIPPTAVQTGPRGQEVSGVHGAGGGGATESDRRIKGTEAESDQAGQKR